MCIAGRGAIGLVSQGKRQSFNIDEGDIVKISAGTTLYMINSDRDVKLRMAMLLQSVSLLGEFQVFFLVFGPKIMSNPCMLLIFFFFFFVENLGVLYIHVGILSVW